MNRHQQRVVLLFSLLLISAALLGCANNDRVAERDDDRVAERDDAPPQVYGQNIARARASIEEAEQAGAEEFGSAQLTQARDKLRAAEDAAEDGAVERAERLAVEADLDADLATAITRNQQTQALATEVQSGLRTLEDELRRRQDTSFDRP